METTFDIVVEMDDNPPITPRRGSYNQIATRAYGAGIKYAMRELCGDDPVTVYMVTRMNGQEIDRMKI